MANATPGVNPYAKPTAAVADAGEAYQDVKIFSTSGRIGRVRYIAYGMGIYFLFAILGAVLSGAGGAIGGVAAIVAWIAMVVVGFMLTIQRCHDFNTTGWLSLLVLVPFVNLIFWFIPGTDGENNYGAKTPPNGVGVIIAACIVPIIAVVGILAAIALPAYQQYVTKAKAAQQQMQQQQAPKR